MNTCRIRIPQFSISWCPVTVFFHGNNDTEREHRSSSITIVHIDVSYKYAINFLLLIWTYLLDQSYFYSKCLVFRTFSIRGLFWKFAKLTNLLLRRKLIARHQEKQASGWADRGRRFDTGGDYGDQWKVRRISHWS